LESNKAVPAKPTREEFEDAVVAWNQGDGERRDQQHPTDFPNGREDIIYSFDNEVKQDQAGTETCELDGIALQKRRRVLARYSPEQHKVSCSLVEKERETRGRLVRNASAQWAREVLGTQEEKP
jgi:hypothetical protein